MGTRPLYRSLAPFRFWWELPRPTDWAAELGRDAPLHVEIGCGNGDWLARQIATQGDRNWVAIELEWSRIAKTLRKLSRLDASHTAVIQLDADRALQRCFAPRSVAALTCLFPEPWPRERHAKHRLFSERALVCCASRLVDGGELRIVTDHLPYTEWIVSHVPACFTLERGRVGRLGARSHQSPRS